MQREVELDWIIHFCNGYSFRKYFELKYTDELTKILCER
jgi:hypothetical protein